jgi:dimethylargininase
VCRTGARSLLPGSLKNGKILFTSAVPVRVKGCLHLKSACCILDRETLLVNRTWLETAPLSGVRLVDVPGEEPSGANVLAVSGATLVSAACPRTAGRVADRGHAVVVLDVSELHKAEAGLTCMSLVFPDEARFNLPPPGRG